MYNPHLKAAPTMYNNVRFDSQLEAKWATFFDCMKINWEYNPERIHLSTNRFYRPDFFLDKLNCFAEIKPKGYYDAPDYHDAVGRISDGMREGTWAGIFVMGDPVDYEAKIFCQAVDDNGRRPYVNFVRFALDPVLKRPILYIEHDTDFKRFYASASEPFFPIRAATRCSGDEERFITQQVLDSAWATKSANYVHGNKPNTKILPEWW